MTEISNLGRYSTGRKPLKEYVTPYKLGVLVTLREYRVMREGNDGPFPGEVETFTEGERRDVMITMIKLLQATDMSCKELTAKIKSVGKEKYYSTVMERLELLYEEGIKGVMDYFKLLSKLFEESDDEQTKEVLLSRSSVMGLFVRRMVLAFDKLSFSQITKFYNKYKAYYCGVTMDDLDNQDISMDIDKLEQGVEEANINNGIFGSGTYSQRQAEYFISKQVGLLQHNEAAALPPPKLQKSVTELLKSAPHLAEAHFLSYLNNLRISEYCGAVHSLYHYFDRHALLSAIANVSAKDDKLDESNKRFRYAALSLASLHYRFGHREEALSALKEAIQMAQETNDNVCLQHALGWLYRLGEQQTANTANLMNRAVGKSGELNLHYLTSLGIQAFAQNNALSTATPHSIFEYLVNSDVLNCQHSQLDLISTGYAQKTALWNMYGNRQMACLTSQSLLNLETSEYGISHSAEGECIAMCNLAKYHAEQGLYEAAAEILNNAKKHFPKTSEWSTLWVLVKQSLVFDKAILSGNLSVAEEAMENIAAIKEHEARYRRAILFKERGDPEAALNILRDLSAEYNNNKRQWTADFVCRVLLAKGEIYCQTGNQISAIPQLLECVYMASAHHLFVMVSLANMHIAYVQYSMNLPFQALKLIENDLVVIMTHGSLYDQARTKCLFAKCQVAAAEGDESDKRKTALLSAANMMENVIEIFRKIEAHIRTKNALYFQARLYHELGYTAERNKCALQFRQLDQQPGPVKLQVLNTF